jgi:hypothetical protein
MCPICFREVEIAMEIFEHDQAKSTSGGGGGDGGATTKNVDDASSSGDSGQIFSTDRVYQLPGSEDQEQAVEGTITEQSEKGKRKRKDAVNAAAKKAKEFKF